MLAQRSGTAIAARNHARYHGREVIAEASSDSDDETTLCSPRKNAVRLVVKTLPNIRSLKCTRCKGPGFWQQSKKDEYRQPCHFAVCKPCGGSFARCEATDGPPGSRELVSYLPPTRPKPVPEAAPKREPKHANISLATPTGSSRKKAVPVTEGPKPRTSSGKSRATQSDPGRRRSGTPHPRAPNSPAILDAKKLDVKKAKVQKKQVARMSTGAKAPSPDSSGLKGQPAAVSVTDDKKGIDSRFSFKIKSNANLGGHLDFDDGYDTPTPPARNSKKTPPGATNARKLIHRLDDDATKSNAATAKGRPSPQSATWSSNVKIEEEDIVVPRRRSGSVSSSVIVISDSDDEAKRQPPPSPAPSPYGQGYRYVAPVKALIAAGREAHELGKSPDIKAHLPLRSAASGQGGARTTSTSHQQPAPSKPPQTVDISRAASGSKRAAAHGKSEDEEDDNKRPRKKTTRANDVAPVDSSSDLEDKGGPEHMEVDENEDDEDAGDAEFHPSTGSSSESDEGDEYTGPLENELFDKSSYKPAVRPDASLSDAPDAHRPVYGGPSRRPSVPSSVSDDGELDTLAVDVQAKLKGYQLVMVVFQRLNGAKKHHAIAVEHGQLVYEDLPREVMEYLERGSLKALEYYQPGSGYKTFGRRTKVNVGPDTPAIPAFVSLRAVNALGKPASGALDDVIVIEDTPSPQATQEPEKMSRTPGSGLAERLAHTAAEVAASDAGCSSKENHAPVIKRRSKNRRVNVEFQ